MQTNAANAVAIMKGDVKTLNCRKVELSEFLCKILDYFPPRTCMELSDSFELLFMYPGGVVFDSNGKCLIPKCQSGNVGLSQLTELHLN